MTITSRHNRYVLIFRRSAIGWATIGWWVSNLALAQDRVLIQQPGGSRIPITGVVDDYTGRDLRFRTIAKDAVKRYPRSEVIEVTTEYTAHHDRGRKLLAAGKIAEAKVEFTAALSEEDRPWVRREILAGQVRCALWESDYASAISRFVPIVDSDAETFHYNLIPLNWTDDEPSTRLQVAAREWIAPSATPHAKLIGASWLLSTSDRSTEAEQLLKKLAREPDVRVQRLAQTQIWRTNRKGSQVIDAEEIERWQSFVEDLPVELRSGVYFVIGEAWKERRDYDRAARAFLWLPLVFDADRGLCARACFEAAESLRALGDLSQAINLYSEVVFRYGDTRWGRLAEDAWKAIRQSKSELNNQTNSGTDPR